MTLEELDHNLPNGFHDAEIFSFGLDYVAGTAKFRMNLLVGWPDDPEPERQAYQEATLVVSGLCFCAIDPPSSTYPFLARDEVANMAWVIERTIPSVTGAGRSGKDEARETLQYQQQLVAAGAPPSEPFRAAIAYLAMTTVPENWIPFMPAHVSGSVREIQLQRSRMLRIIPGASQPPPKVAPRTTLMREGLDVPPPQLKHSYFVHEEEVPRAGAQLSESFRSHTLD